MTQTKPAPRIAITYCSMCNWMLRSAWLGQELLSTFGQDLGEGQSPGVVATLRIERAPSTGAARADLKRDERHEHDEGHDDRPPHDGAYPSRSGLGGGRLRGGLVDHGHAGTASGRRVRNRSSVAASSR